MSASTMCPSVEIATGNQIDKLGRALRAGNFCGDDLILLDRFRQSFDPAYKTVVDVARSRLGLAVTGRPSKSTGSIVDKLRRESTRLDQMQDIAGCRVVVPDIAKQEVCAHALQIFLPGTQLLDRRLKPSNGYRAIHLVAHMSGRCVEVQVRTELQHHWAEISEKLADTVHPEIKYGGGHEGCVTLLAKLSSMITEFESLEADRAAALKALEGRKSQLRHPLKRRLHDAELTYRSRRKSLTALFERIRLELNCVRMEQ